MCEQWASKPGITLANWKVLETAVVLGYFYAPMWLCKFTYCIWVQQELLLHVNVS
jgi:hypothetical protein